MRTESWLAAQEPGNNKNAAITQIVQPKLHPVLITPNRDTILDRTHGHLNIFIFIAVKNKFEN